MSDAPKCVVCGEAADTIRNGRDCCARHHEGHTPEVPIVVCDVDGCGCTAVANVGGRDLCRDHAGWAGYGRAA